MNLVQLVKRFPTEEDCIKHLEAVRWANGITCPYCKSHKTSQHNIAGRRQNRQCQTCSRSFGVTVGTIFHNTHLDLRNWFYILSLMLNAKKGLSACQVARDIGVRRPTVWAIMHKIRKAFATEQKELLKGIFEMDETFVKTNKSNTKEDEDDNDSSSANFDDFDDDIPHLDNKKTSNANKMDRAVFENKILKTHTAIVGIKQRGGDLKAFATENTISYFRQNCNGYGRIR